MVIDDTTFRAFTDEMLLIKVAEEDNKVTGSEAGRALKNLGLGALAYAAGSQAAWFGSKKLFPRILPPTAPPSRASMLGKGIGILTAAGTLALADAIAENTRMVRDSSKRDK